MNLAVLKEHEKIFLKILKDIKNKNFPTIKELKDFYKNEYDKIIETLFKSGYITDEIVHLTVTGISYLEQLEKISKNRI